MMDEVPVRGVGAARVVEEMRERNESTRVVDMNMIFGGWEGSEWSGKWEWGWDVVKLQRGRGRREKGGGQRGESTASNVKKNLLVKKNEGELSKLDVKGR